MNNVILQPCGSIVAKQHYQDTILRRIYIESISKFLSKDQKKDLLKIYPGGTCMIWGVTPSSNSVSKWKRIKVGDVTLFSGNKKIFASAIVTNKLQNRKLASYLWDFDENGKTWEYVYFLDEHLNQNIPYIEFNKVVGYKLNYIIQGFNVLDSDKSLKFLNKFDLNSDTHLPDISEDNYKQTVEKLSILEESEVEYLTKRRLEQSHLRNLLFGNKSIAKCSCCHKELPTSLLVTAHIKKRSFCSIEEKLDENIVMPMCKLGCDELYEKGFIFVIEGKIEINYEIYKTKDVEAYLRQIEKKECKFFNSNSRKYFEWHYNHHK